MSIVFTFTTVRAWVILAMSSAEHVNPWGTDVCHVFRAEAALSLRGVLYWACDPQKKIVSPNIQKNTPWVTPLKRACFIWYVCTFKLVPDHLCWWVTFLYSKDYFLYSIGYLPHSLRESKNVFQGLPTNKAFGKRWVCVPVRAFNQAYDSKRQVLQARRKARQKWNSSTSNWNTSPNHPKLHYFLFPTIKIHSRLPIRLGIAACRKK